MGHMGNRLIASDTLIKIKINSQMITELLLKLNWNLIL